MRKMTPEHKAALQAGRLAARARTRKEPKTPLAAIRANCLECCGTAHIVKFCPCDGTNSTRCYLWPFRFGKRPSTMKRGPNGWLLDPEKMPGADVAQEDCSKESE